ncbi:hypothetical protein [Rossellomorea sp. DUT-2]|uniref:nSTAND3 domain-containing NTPase n=1 Tax=Rossellomorea sp. DUT-2 TaxID=3412021 RepID=UPI003D176F8E
MSSKLFQSLLNDIKVNNAVVIVGAGVSFEPGMPLYSQLAPIVWEVVSCYPDIDDKFIGTGSTKNRIGEESEKLKEAFGYIEQNEDALHQFKSIFKKLNDKIILPPEIHKNIARLIHENFFELVVSFNWDSLLELSWSELYGTHINARKKNMIKPHGDVLNLSTSWILPNSPGRVTENEKEYVNMLAKERPRTLVIVGYSENDTQIVKDLISPFENRWKVYRVSPFSISEDSIQYTAREFFERLVEETIDSEKYKDWEFLNFQNQNKSIGRAILGYKLTPQDVEICPKLPQVERAIRILKLNNYVIIKGKPGSGKSISSYQIAYSFLKEGYEIIRFRVENFTDVTNLNIPFNPRAIYIIDDAQVLPNSLLLKLQEKSSENQKFILSVTDDIEVDSAVVSIVNVENIEGLREFYLKNKATVTEVISSIDNDIGDFFMQESFEDRISVASQQGNLWMFNYFLRGGWKDTEANYFQAKELNSSQRIIFLLSLKQIISKDKVVDLNWLSKVAKTYFSEEEEWVNRTLEQLRRKKLIDSSNIRMIHYEAAKKQLNYIFNNDKENRTKYEEVIKEELLSSKNSLLGKVWFLNATFSGGINHCIASKISVNEFYNIVDESIRTSAQRINVDAMYFIDVLKRSIRGYEPFDIYKYSSHILFEIEHVTNETAYPLSRVINELYNTHHEEAKELGNRLNIEKVAGRVSTLQKDHLFQWSKFISRLGLLFNRDNAWKFRQMLDEKKIEKQLLSMQNSKPEFESLVEFIETIYSYDKELANKFFYLKDESFKAAFKQDPLEAWNSLGFTFTAFLMGFNSLKSKREYIKKPQKKISERIVSYINPEQLAEDLIKVPFRKWHNLSHFYHIIKKIDPNKYGLLIKSLDLDRINKKFDANNVWLEFHSEINEFLFLFIDQKYIKIIDDFIFENKEKLLEKNAFQFAVSPKLINDHLSNDIYIPMYRGAYSKDRLEWQALEVILYILNNSDRKLLQSFLINKSKEIANAISSFDQIDLNSIINFLDFLKGFDGKIFNNIKESIDLNLLNQKVYKCLNFEYYSREMRIENKETVTIFLKQLDLTKNVNFKQFIDL